MTPRLSTFEDHRRTRRTLFIVAAVYVSIGFFIAAPAALAGEPLTAFLGCLVICGALAGSVGLNAVLKLSAQMSEMGNALDDLRRGLHRIEDSLPTLDTMRMNASSAESAANMDMDALGVNLAALTAATFDRNAYPRLAISSVDKPRPNAPDTAGSDRPNRPKPTTTRPDPRDTDEHADADASNEVADDNLLRKWAVAMRNADLCAARKVFPELADKAAPDVVAKLRTQLRQLTCMTEASLRERFTTCVDQGDYTGALDVGERMCALLPEHRITVDFRRIRPHLQRRARETMRPEAILAAVP
ncbi:MAG: hypothetical protein JSU63_01860 [Phycisphaerales bacterium]|nr:MAG: hypothetical protein JSU63_01860 [Phycisphaerales bacterium]